MNVCREKNHDFHDDFKDLALAFCYEFYYEWQIRINSIVDDNEDDLSKSVKLIRKN